MLFTKTKVTYKKYIQHNIEAVCLCSLLFLKALLFLSFSVFFPSFLLFVFDFDVCNSRGFESVAWGGREQENCMYVK